jgi:hypothetical protein
MEGFPSLPKRSSLDPEQRDYDTHNKENQEIAGLDLLKPLGNSEYTDSLHFKIN